MAFQIIFPVALAIYRSQANNNAIPISGSLRRTSARSLRQPGDVAYRGYKGRGPGPCRHVRNSRYVVIISWVTFVIHYSEFFVGQTFGNKTVIVALYTGVSSRWRHETLLIFYCATSWQEFTQTIQSCRRRAIVPALGAYCVSRAAPP